MTVPKAQFRKRDYQPDPTYFGAADPVNDLKDVDGSTYAVLTNAHEMGHATGNWDQYLYNYEDAAKFNWTGLPTYEQPFTAEGGPYTCDELARMYHNRTPRLRNFWKFVLWLNDESAAGKSLNKFLSGTKYQITFQGLKHKHQFSLPDDSRNIEAPSRKAIDHTITTASKVDLLLYRLGDDELSRMIKGGQVFDGILAVKIRLALKFTDNPPELWGGSKLAWAQQLNNNFKAMLNKKFRVSKKEAGSFRNVLLQFTPSFQVYTGAPPADSQFNIETVFKLGGTFTTNNNTMTVDWDTNNNQIIRYCFGKTTGNGNLTKDDFTTIINWLGTPAVGNAVYTTHNL
jgi:hypothetical protein